MEQLMCSVKVLSLYTYTGFPSSTLENPKLRKDHRSYGMLLIGTAI
jgi:hypothetical protein